MVQWCSEILADIVLQAVKTLKTSFNGGQPSTTVAIPGSVADCISGWAECQLKPERWQSLFVCAHGLVNERVSTSVPTYSLIEVFHNKREVTLR